MYSARRRVVRPGLELNLAVRVRLFGSGAVRVYPWLACVNFAKDAARGGTWGVEQREEKGRKGRREKEIGDKEEKTHLYPRIRRDLVLLPVARDTAEADERLAEHEARGGLADVPPPPPPPPSSSAPPAPAAPATEINSGSNTANAPIASGGSEHQSQFPNGKRWRAGRGRSPTCSAQVGRLTLGRARRGPPSLETEVKGCTILGGGRLRGSKQDAALPRDFGILFGGFLPCQQLALSGTALGPGLPSSCISSMALANNHGFLDLAVQSRLVTILDLYGLRPFAIFL
ncbi:hypothetical protein B0H13DRAFT_1906185 [Mycena leptocephala]|nr:hypothetical protein B0H13DRAFT_1906185 [Mycena leptocephala]